jgi:uncharacterized membrane protein
MNISTSTDRDGTRSTPRWLSTAVSRLEGMPRLDAPAGRLDPVAETVAGGSRAPMLEGRWLGHALHPMLTDLPLGCWISSALLDLLGGPGSQRASRRLTGIGVLVAGPTAASGLAEWRLIRDAPTRRVGVVHAVMNVLVTALYAKSWWTRRRHPVRGALTGMLAGSVAVVSGYLGGHLSFVRRAGSGPRGWSDVPRGDLGGLTAPSGSVVPGADAMEHDGTDAGRLS